MTLQEPGAIAIWHPPSLSDVMGKHTEKAKAREPAMIGVLPSLTGGEKG
jgi:hypothetical protein